MRRQVQERDFTVVICTETYSRRSSGDETPGVGKGAAWQGRLLRQILNEAGKNDHVIPAVFGRADINHIPLELKDATYYDVSTDDGYERLHRALTGQPLVQPAPLGPVRRQLPTLIGPERDCVSVLALCPDPVPQGVVARQTTPKETVPLIGEPYFRKLEPRSPKVRVNSPMRRPRSGG